MLSDMPKAIRAKKTSTALTDCTIFPSLTVKSIPNIRAITTLRLNGAGINIS